MNPTRKTCIRICVCVFLLFLAIYYWPTVSGLIPALVGAASPLLIGCAVAYVVNILMVALERIWFPRTRKVLLQKTRRPVCLILSFLAVLLILLLVVALILPQLINCVKMMINEIPGLIRAAIVRLKEWGLLSHKTFDSLFSIDWSSKLENTLDMIVSGVGSLLQIVINVIASVFGGLMTALIAVIFATYLLLQKEQLAAQFTRLGRRFLKPHRIERILHVCAVLHDSFRRFIIGQCTEAVILGLLCMTGMWILRLPYAAMVSALVAFTALIPVAGCYIGAFGGAFMILTVSPIKALIFLVFIMILQQLENNLIYPRVVGASIGLPGIWVLVAVTVGGGMFGIPGMLVSVPVAATLYKLLREDLNKEKATEAAEEASKASSTEPSPAKAPAAEPAKVPTERDKKKSKKKK